MERAQQKWTVVVAMAKNDVIGRSGQLPWRLSSDLQRFKRMTMGHCLLMGRKTFESIGRALPGRQTIVLSQQGLAKVPTGVTVIDSIDKVDQNVEPERKVMVVGGGEIYQAALSRCDTIWLTRILTEVKGDVLFPAIDWTEWQLSFTETFDASPKDDWPTEFQVWTRIHQS